jgi:DNA-binding transcriptional MerR regulator
MLREKIEQWQRLGVVLQSSADIIKTRIKDARDNFTEPEKNLCKATEEFVEDFLKDLEELQRKRPTTKEKDGSKYWLSLKTWLHEDEELFTRLSRNAQIFQLSTSALAL